MANWYKRSRNSEHNWDQFCIELLALLKSGNAWFTTVSETMSGFFRKRRSVTLVQEADVIVSPIMIYTWLMVKLILVIINHKVVINQMAECIVLY